MSHFKEIYKYFYDYFKIYKASLGFSVAKWTQTDLENAIKWSKNCEDLSKKLERKSFFNNFVQELKLIINHWKLNFSQADSNVIIIDIMKNATKHIKKVNFNVYEFKP